MTVPTNWPNPERPGVPMFPERDGWHAIRTPLGTEFLVKWDSNSRRLLNLSGSPVPVERHPKLSYIGPVLTPTQLTDLLAGKYSIPLIQTALRVWDALDECDRTDADDLILLEKNGLMTRGIVEDANEFEDLEVGETVWHFNAAGDTLVSAIRNPGDAP